jgi:aminotransferase EvaB
MKLKQLQKSKKSSPKIFVWSYLEDYKKNKKKILEITDRVFSSGNLILSKEVINFENNFSNFTNNNFGVGVNSGTDALQIALMSIGIKKNDEVITVSNTAVPTVSAIISCNAKPIFVDVNENDFLMNALLIEQKITKKTKAIIPVNLYGQSANYELINKISKKNNLKVIEDCAQSAGALYKNKPSGSLGDLGAFSFYPTKNLGGYGDGGMIVTKNKKLYLNCKKLRKYGMNKSYYADIHGINSRLDEVQAAILNFQLTKLKSNIIKRRKIAKIYNENLKTPFLELPIENKNNFHAYYVYVVKHPQRKKIMHYLKDNDIFCNISYPYPIHSMKGYSYLNKKISDLPITNKLSKQIFSLPMYPELDTIKLEKVINTLNKF